MPYSIQQSPMSEEPTGCLVVGVYQKQRLSSAARLFDEKHDNLIAKLLQRDEIKAKVGNTLLCINPDSNSPIQRILLVGLGKESPLNVNEFRKAVSAAAKTLKESVVTDFISTLTGVEVKDRTIDWKVAQTVELFEATLYQFTQMKSEAKEPKTYEHIGLLLTSNDDLSAAEQGLQHGIAVAHGVALAKELANLPGNICTPTYLAEQAIELSHNHATLSVEILEEHDMEELGMGALLSVSKGSREPAKLIVLKYSAAKNDHPPIVFIGKGLTFDAGGISLKPSAGMDEMKYDMCAGAAVIGTLSAAASLELPLNIVGIIPASENLPDGAANKPGDIVTSMAGKTIEILNTDAEGRLLLCDALTYAKRFNPAKVIDLATLTGACLVALGRTPSGLLGNDQDLCDALLAAGEVAADRAWQLPMWEEYQELLHSNFADIANIGGRDAGTITAACFLARFAKEFSWAHLDIAGTAWKTGKAKGATGRPVPLLVQYLCTLAAAE